MKKFLIAFAFSLAACGPSADQVATAIAQTQAAQPTVAPTVSPACKAEICIKQAFAKIDSDAFFVQFDLTDRSGVVNAVNPPEFPDELFVGVFLLQNGKEDQYVVGAKMPKGSYTCYAGNDLPWANGAFGSVCSLAVRASQTQVEISPGNLVRIEEPDFGFKQIVTITSGK